MPTHLRARVITRDVSKWPHRDLENTELRTDIEMWWGDKPVPQGYVTVFELGEQKLDFEGGLDLTPHTPSNYDTSLDSSDESPDVPGRVRRAVRPRGHRTTRKKKAGRKVVAGRSRGSAQSA